VARAAGMRVMLSLTGDEVTAWASSDADQEHHVRAPAAPVFGCSTPHI